MQIEINRLQEAKGYILYQRAKNKMKGCASWPKYFIKNDDTYQELRTLAKAKSEFKKLTT